MGIVSEKEFDSELGKLSPDKGEVKREESNSHSDSEVTIIDMHKGRGIGNVEVPDALRKVIGLSSITEGRDGALEIARQFGISPSSASAYSVGARSTTSYDERPNKPVINEVKERVSKKARGRLMAALNALTPEKIREAKARDIAGIAKDMAVVIKEMEPDKDKGSEKDNTPQFVFYAPTFRDERSFDTITVKET